MYKITITDHKNSNKLYDKIFNIIDKHTMLFKINASNEYETPEGYTIEINHLSFEMTEEIERLKGVEIDFN